MTAHQLGRNGQTQPRATFAGGAAERDKQRLLRLGGQARPGIGDLNVPDIGQILRRNGDHAGLAGGGQRLTGIAHEVLHHTKELLGIGAQGKARRHIIAQLKSRPIKGQPLAFEHIRHQPAQLEHGERRRGLFGAPEGQRRFAQRHRARDRIHQLRRQPPDQRILRHFDPVGKKLRRGQDIAQIMADLGHRPAKLGQTLFLLQGVGQLGLEGLERLFGLAQLGHAGFRLNDPAGIFGGGGIALHELDHALDRAHQQQPHRHKQQHRRKDGDHDRQDQNADAIVDHGRAHLAGVHRHLDQQPRIAHRRADHADDVIPRRHHTVQRIHDQLERPVMAQIERVRDGRRDR